MRRGEFFEIIVLKLLTKQYNYFDKLCGVRLMNANTVFALIFLTIVLFIIIRILIGPLKMFFKIIYSCILSTIGILGFNFIGNVLGLHIGVNIINILVIGMLGFPGMALVLFLQLIFKT